MNTVPDLPLFPLQQPLFPGIQLPLQIFEQRYLTLVRDVMRTGGSFGIVPIISGREVGRAPDIHPRGVLVTIRDWNQLDNGLLGITVAGDQRIRVGNLQVQSDGLLRGDAEVFPPDELEAVTDGDRDLLELFEDLAGQLQLTEWLPGAGISVSALGWRLLSLLPFDPQWRLGLLAEDDPHQRLKAIRRHLVDLGRR
ncbi:MAG: LON peptidase substrate-binding domain-containing protein [Porticoccaceae bacterium]